MNTTQECKKVLIITGSVLGGLVLGLATWAFLVQFGVIPQTFSNSIGAHNASSVWLGRIGEKQFMIVSFNPISRTVSTFGNLFEVKHSTPTPSLHSSDFSVVIPDLIPNVPTTMHFQRSPGINDKMRLTMTRDGVTPVTVQLQPLTLEPLGVYMSNLTTKAT